jgi:GNAT superfamily N-acetyltransferase
LSEILIRNTRPEDIREIIDLCQHVYQGSPPWGERQLESHQGVFPEGQFVAVDSESGKVVGMAASLIIFWHDYDIASNWRDFTDSGMFTNHDPERGRTLYGAEVMVHPQMQGRGVGKRIYDARRQLVEKLGLARIRAGARLRGYSQYANELAAEDYVKRVVRGEIGDPTLSFQLKQGFHVLAVVPEYLRHDPESKGHAAVIEKINPAAARPEDYPKEDQVIR